MNTLFSKLESNDTFFWTCALIGSGLFIIQFLLNLFSADHHDDAMDPHAGDDDFKWLSKQTVVGFLMLFGWVGLTCKKEFHLSIVPTLLFAFSGGLVAFFITGYIFKLAKKLQSSGTVFRIEDAVGKEATIYQEILKEKRGKVSVSIDNFTHEIEAVSPYEEDLPSFTSVQIINKLDDHTVIVIPKR